jgi:hypothetical protein
MKKLKYIAPVLIALVGQGLQQAKVDTLSFDLTQGNPGIPGFTGPYANVNINLTSSTTATITFTSLTNSGNIYLMGDGSTVALNVNASSFTVGTITGTNNGGALRDPSLLILALRTWTDGEALISQSIALTALGIRQTQSLSP